MLMEKKEKAKPMLLPQKDVKLLHDNVVNEKLSKFLFRHFLDNDSFIVI
jgi:hypothetical protein